MKPGKLLYYVLILTCTVSASYAQKLNLLIGTYTKPGKSEGIYVYEFDIATGKAIYKNKITGLTNPSYLAVNKDENCVYAVNEDGPGKGSVSALAYDKQTGALSMLNQESSKGNGPCYVTVGKGGKHVFVANYSGGSFSVLPVFKDGSLGEVMQNIQYHPNGKGKGQQAAAHAHSTVLSPDEKHLFVSDLGNDQILSYDYSAAASTPLTIATAKITILPDGRGPRHFEFHPGGKFAYSIQEINSEIFAYTYKNGTLSFLQSISTLPEGFSGRKWAADVHVSPDGKFLYASNRDDANDIAIFSIQKNGKLVPAGHESTLGKTPRGFVIDPTGNYLLVAHQNSDTIMIFKRNQKTGQLSYTGDKIDVGSPVCLKFTAAE